jgi:spermidine/putrescine transport system permease protein
MMQKDIKRLSLILLFAPFALWIALLIILPHLGMFHLAAREGGAARLRVRL